MACKPINTAIASYGMSGSVFHAPLLSAHPGFVFYKILERSAKGCRRRYSDVISVGRFEELISDPEVELVVVNTPDATHFALCHAALEAGKHVVVEKPFALNAGEAIRLAELAGRNRRMLCVFQNRRWDSDFMTVGKVLDGQLLGRLVSFEAHFDRYRNYLQPGTWKEERSTGFEILYNLGSHLIDQAYVLFGLPLAVWADIGIQRTGGAVDDFFMVRLRYETLSVTLQASYLVREPGPRYILHGTHGSFLKWGTDPQEEFLKAGGEPGMPGWGVEEAKYRGKLNTEIDGAHLTGMIESRPGNYLAFYDGVYAAIREGQAPPVLLSDSVDVMRIIDAAICSNARREEVSLSDHGSD
jgi:scyllo-inositol 2-dehydrogenase (NADP+)